MAGVVACAPVSAGAMVGAIIQILIAKQATPALLADAIPGLGAGAVHAARMPLALVAELAHPARMTTEIKKTTVSKNTT